MGNSHGLESCRLQEGACQSRSSGHEGSQSHRQIYGPGPRDVEGEDEASDEGWQAGDVRQSGGGESKASQEGCQSVRSGSAEEERLSRHFWSMCACGQSTWRALHALSRFVHVPFASKSCNT